MTESPHLASPHRLQLYVLTVAGMSVALFTLAALHGAGESTPTPLPTPLLAAVLLVAAVLSERFPLHLTYQTKVDVDTTVLTATAFLLDVPTAMVVAALALAFREALARDSWEEGIFNPAQAALYVGAGSAVFHALRDVPIPPDLPGLGSLVAVAASALTMHLLNSLAVAIAGALHLGADPTRSSRGGLWLDAPENAALVVFGVIVAVVATDHPWVLAAFVLPLGLVHRSLRRGIELQAAAREAVEEFADIVDRRDPDTVGHSQRVSTHVARLAERLGLSGPEHAVVTAASRVHDIGKVALDPRVVAKPGPLAPADWDEIRRHPDIGARLISRFPSYALGARAIRHHHERWDGTGYPDGLAGEEIPLGARIIAVADAFDAMTCRRPHRPALSDAAALAELERGRGRQWDPRVVEAMVALVREDRVARQPAPAPAREAAGTLRPTVG